MRLIHGDHGEAMRRIIAFVLIAGCATTMSMAQVYISAHGTVGTTLVDVGFKSIGSVTLPRTAQPWDATGGMSIGGSVSFLAPLAGDALVGVEVGMRTLSVEGTSTEQTTVLVDGQPTTASFAHTMTSDVTVLTALLVLRYPIVGGISLELGTGMATAITSSSTQTERITEPPSLTFVEGGTARTVIDGADADGTIGALVVPGLVWRTSLAASLALEAGLGVAAHLGPVTKGSDLVSWIPHARVGISYQIGSAEPDDVTP